MAFSTGFATYLVGSKVETTVLFNPTWSCSSSSSFLKGQQIRVFCKPNQSDRRNQRGVRCEVASAPDASTLSALKQLKTSIADRNFLFLFFYFQFCFSFFSEFCNCLL
ncbi:hypothetical protein ACOSQ4_030948 [Xanthoceras sorbifolium]